MNLLQTADPDVWQAIQHEAAPPAGRPGDDRLGELHQPRRHGGPGLRAHQQVRRGLCPASATTAAASSSMSSSGSPSSGCSSSSAPSTPTSSRTPGAQANMAVYFACLQPGDTILAMDLAHGGHLTHGMHLNFSGKFYKVVGYGVTPGRRAHRLRPGRQAGPRAQAEADRRRRQRLSARDRLRQVRRDLPARSAPCSWWTWPTSPAWSPPSSITSPVPFADFVTSTTHKTLRGPRGGFVLCKQDWGQKINSAVFPGMQGGPLMHVIAAKAVAFGEALQPDVQRLRRPGDRQRQDAGPRAAARTASASSPAAPTITCCWWTSPRAA